MKNTLSKISIALALTLAFSSAAFAEKEGYLIDSRANVVRDNYNECWRTGYWTPAMAIAECDPDLVKKEAPKAEAAPAPVPAASGPEKAAFAKITLQAETLFDFDKAVVRADGKKKLDEEVVAKMKEYPEVEVVLITGHADRIGSDAYNMKLSERRAIAVKDYLVSQGIETKRIETVARGKSEPVVSCSDIKGKANRHNKKLIACLQPNRRVVVEVRVQKPTQE
ncbi:MAG: OmpA family protein [Sulfurimicrobium sp.]